MKKQLKRGSSVLLAILLGIGIVYALTFIGDNSSGPIDDALQTVGENVTSLENRMAGMGDAERRSSNLSWVEPYQEKQDKFKWPAKMLLGAYDDIKEETFGNIVSLEDSLGVTLPLIHIYTAWGDKKEEEFPQQECKKIIELGSTPLITWEPWLSDFSDENYPKFKSKPNKDLYGMKLVASGAYDDYIRTWAQHAKEMGKPIFIRLGHEMNDPYRYPWGPQNNKPEEFIAAWRHVYQVFKTAGANNVIWIWSPHPAYGQFKSYYPGANYVDWLGVGTLNYGTVAIWSKWWSFDEIFGNYYDSLSMYKKPIMVTEFGSLGVGGNRTQWYKDALEDMPTKYPMIRSLVFFHTHNDNTTTYKALDWSFKNDRATTEAIRGIIAKW